ncbi:NAD(P)H-quinone oxidoreductase subunit F [Chroococcidiopsis sp.]|uniref:NAD(P)H-quinone oxidoreductase subunit F n=1 Tax=Chroococcidiopsis sp. TaxID=3088168 RepID=UPI003F404797
MADTFLQTIWLVPIYALIGAISTIPWSPGIIRRTGPRPAAYINLVTTALAFTHALIALSASWNKPAQYLYFSWLHVANFDFTIAVEVSSLTVGAIALVTGLNVLAIVFAIGYLEMDWGWARFHVMMALFEAGMCALVLCNSLFFSYFILEILTLCTYLLLGFWFSQPLVVTGARDAFLTKRVGDLFLLMGVLALYPLAGTWDFSELARWAQTANVNPTAIALVCLALIAGPMGKCAVFPLHLWLDEAMEGPVPATILRNSVVVATGAWVLVKLQPVLALSPFALSFATFIGAVTAVGASLIVIAQVDVKRALSYSVSAFMGLVFVAVGTGQSQAALLLVFTHAVAISLLVMSTGGVVWNSITQDLRLYGGLWSRRPISAIAFIVGAAGLVAFPPLGGFWALLQIADGLWTTQPLLVGVILVTNALTAFSVTRVFCLMFGNKPKPMTVRSPEVHWPMMLPMTILMGFVMHAPLVLQSLSLLPEWAYINKDVALLLIWSTIFGCSISAVVYLSPLVPKPVTLPWKPLQDFFAYDLYTANLYRVTIVFGVAVVSRLIALIDRYLVDGIVNLVGLVSIFGGETLKYSTSGHFQFYALTILLGVSCLGAIVGWPLLSHMELSFSF